MKEEKNYFASNLRFLRQKNGLEQIDLATTRLGRKSSSSISEWEKGKYTPKAGVLNDIANIFGVSLSKLMSTDLSNPSAQNEEESSTFKMIQRKAKNLSVTDQERLLQIMELTFQDISNGGVEDDHDF